jgi:very-short-patch-repair endonuclease
VEDEKSASVGSTEIAARARQLRHTITPAEAQLWAKLRDRICAGFKFRRLVAIGPFIVDFVCFEVKLIVEVDGSSHEATVGYDGHRTKQLELQGYSVVRFTNEDVRDNLGGVWEEIRELCGNRATRIT